MEESPVLRTRRRRSHRRGRPLEPGGRAKSPGRLAAAGDAERWIQEAMVYVPSVARHFASCGVPLDELRAAGNLGLVQAAVRFDPSRRIKFVTYADWWIRKAILKTIQEQSGPVRLSRYRLEQLRELFETSRRLRIDTGREPNSEELAQATGRSPYEIDLLLGSRRSVSIEQPLRPGESRPLGSLLAADPDKEPQSTLIRRDFRRYLRALITQLSERERRVVTLRFGVGDYSPMTLRQVGIEMGISRERVRQIERRALRNLRDLF